MHPAVKKNGGISFPLVAMSVWNISRRTKASQIMYTSLAYPHSQPHSCSSNLWRRIAWKFTANEIGHCHRVYVFNFSKLFMSYSNENLAPISVPVSSSSSFELCFTHLPPIRTIRPTQSRVIPGNERRIKLYQFLIDFNSNIISPANRKWLIME